MDISRLSPE